MDRRFGSRSAGPDRRGAEVGGFGCRRCGLQALDAVKDAGTSFVAGAIGLADGPLGLADLDLVCRTRGVPLAQFHRLPVRLIEQVPDLGAGVAPARRCRASPVPRDSGRRWSCRGAKGALISASISGNSLRSAVMNGPTERCESRSARPRHTATSWQPRSGRGQSASSGSDSLPGSPCLGCHRHWPTVSHRALASQGVRVTLSIQ